MSVVGTLQRRTTDRVGRLVVWGVVGGIGAVIDLGVTFALLDVMHVLAANAIGFSVAVTVNFTGNWTVTYQRPDGHIGRQYASYVGLHLGTFALRAVALTGAIIGLGAPDTVATVIGVGVASVANFVGTESIFEGAGELWFDAVEAANHLAHAVYHSRLRALLLWSGVYNLIFRTYAAGLSVAYPAPEREISIGDASATVATEQPTETVSVLHTLEKERPILNEFVDDVERGDRVLDVGANLGVFAALAAHRGADVVAVEPHPPTADRLRENCPDATVHELALGDSVGTVGLAIQHDAVGTQRPAVGGSEVRVDQLPGDRLPTPDVLKVDVEGAEVAVLDGLSRTLATDPPRVVYLEAHGDRTEECERRLAAAGYQVDRIEEGAETQLRGEQSTRDDPVSPESGQGEQPADDDGEKQ